MVVEEITHDGERLAFIWRDSRIDDGIRFITSPELSQQLGFMRRPKNYHVAAHRHLPLKREVTQTQETLIVRTGMIVVSLYAFDPLTIVKVVTLEPGDIILLIGGAHEIFFVEESEVIEIKQGPYLESDKQFV